MKKFIQKESLFLQIKTILIVIVKMIEVKQ